MAVLLVAHGFALFVLTFALKRLTPEMAQIMWLAGLGGGVLCILWGVLGLVGFLRRVGAVLTLIPLCLVILGRVVDDWMSRDAAGGLLGPAIATVMLLASIVVLAYILHAGDSTPAAEIPDAPSDQVRPSKTNRELSSELRHRS